MGRFGKMPRVLCLVKTTRKGMRSDVTQRSTSSRECRVDGLKQRDEHLLAFLMDPNLEYMTTLCPTRGPGFGDTRPVAPTIPPAKAAAMDRGVAEPPPSLSR